LICAILNDTTGTLMSCAWKYQDCKIGVIIGTGSNACYVEKAKHAEYFDKPGKTEEETVIINTEFGAFGDHGSLEGIRTGFDRDVDENSINPSNQLFEKMISGMYMGELVRLAIVKLASDHLLFDGYISEKFKIRETFKTKYISEIEEQNENVFHATRDILAEMDIDNPTDDDCIIVRYCCELISKRAAQLVSSALAVLLLRIGDEHVTIGVDGSVYRFHPHFHSLMTETIKQLIPSNYEFQFVLSEDGSGRGAALVAAVASQDIQ
jgi:hexokinase